MLFLLLNGIQDDESYMVAVQSLELVEGGASASTSSADGESERLPYMADGTVMEALADISFMW